MKSHNDGIESGCN